MTNPDHTLYPIHVDGPHVQYAGHVILWNTDEATARTIAAAMCQSPIVGVEIVRQDRKLGSNEEYVATIGKSLNEAAKETPCCGRPSGGHSYCCPR
jgi:hypothetical protein